jgi:hypothetical protein
MADEYAARMLLAKRSSATIVAMVRKFVVVLVFLLLNSLKT